MGLSFGIVVDERSFFAWHTACIQKLEELGHANLRCVISCSNALVADNETEYMRRLGSMGSSSYRTDGFRPLLRPGVTLLNLQIGAGEQVETAVRDMRLDLVLDLTTSADPCIRGESTSFGTWKFLFGDLTTFSSPAVGFWEIYHERAVTAAALVKLSSGDSITALKTGYLVTLHHSLDKNIEAVLKMTVEWPARACQELALGDPCQTELSSFVRTTPRLGYPTNAEFDRLRRIMTRNRRRRYLANRLYRQDWNIASLSASPQSYIGKEASADIDCIHPYERRRFLADPFAFTRASKRYVLCEDFVYHEGRGVISIAEVNKTGYSQLRTIISSQHHLSYPQVFEHNGEVYCLPESVAERKVQLYRARAFPDAWETFGMPIIENFAAVDSTIVKVQERWWLFCTNFDEGYHSHLYLWYSDDLFGKWTPHPRNPVKIDVRSAGPAGPLFWHEGALYRPAQDCSKVYGGCIHLNRILRLNETAFQEEVVGTITPPREGYTEGIHTISGTDGFWIVDVMRTVFNPRGPWAITTDVLKTALMACGFSEQGLRRFSAWVRPPRRRPH